MAEHIQKFKPGAAVTFTASSAVVGGRLVAVSGDRTVAPAAADSAAVVGVASTDAAAGEAVTVFARGAVDDAVAAGEIAAGAAVVAAAAGKVQAHVAAGEGATVNKIAVALSAAAEDGDVVTILWV